MSAPSEIDFDTTVRVAIMDAFVAGLGPSVATVARALDADADHVGAAFDRLSAGRAIVLKTGTRDILMAAPFARTHTEFSVVIGEHSYYANCIWDALGIPAMFAGAGRPAEARIETRCPDCATALGVEVRDGQLVIDGGGAVVHFAVPARRWWADIVFT
jgi:hypothetical protein